ncbi:OsmC family protein [Streptomyces sp. JJ38]|uniref:OsmC family protein n=1 Tax=Streptomyces sp. JJ38 TaxID=2738128 RepID=UPI0027E197D7|nr:OsmC family protein [Streptomyces sp. JJ38]
MDEKRNAGHGEHVRTRCGRDVNVTRFTLPGLPAGMGRVVLDTAREPYDDSEVWASLTPREARRIAALLLAQAAAVEQVDGGPGRVEVVPLGGDAYEASVRGHVLTVDQPQSEGGGDTAPSPVELFVASVATCAAHYAGRFLDRHGLDRGGLRVTAEHTLAAQAPAHVATLALRVDAPGLPPERAAAFEAVVSRCTVKNTLTHPPEIRVALGALAPEPVAGEPSSGRT